MWKSLRARKHLFLRSLQLSIGLLLLIFIAISPLYAGRDGDGSPISSLEEGSSIDLSIDYLEIAGEFYRNQGQIPDSNIHFYTALDGGYLGLGTDRISLWSGYSPPLDIMIFGEPINLEPLGLERTDHTTNYFLGSRGTFTNVQSYRAVLYKEVLPGIDMLFDNPTKGILCEVFAEEGSDSTTAAEMFKVTDRFAWKQEKVSAASENLMKFSFLDRTSGEFILSQDDEVLFSRCFRGSDRDEALSITQDEAENLYITGRTASLNFPVFNAIDSDWNGGYDVFVTKINPSGTTEYSTFIGGGVSSMAGTQPDEVGNDITVDADGNVYITGNTKSDDFPRVNPLYSYPEDNDTLRGEYLATEGDAFVLKLNSTGQIEYSTYFGGKNGDVATSISLDADGNIYIAGRTSSENGFPLVNPIDSLNDAGIYDGFVTCISAAGDTLLFSTFFGGSQNERINDIAIDDSGSLVVTGNTEGGLSLINAFQSTYGGGDLDAFVMKIDSGWNVVYSTYLGGSDSDQGLSICVDSTGTAYVTGRTHSPDFHNVSALYGTYGGSGDCYITAISEDGASIAFSSFVGGDGADTGKCIDVDATGHITVAGTTDSLNFPDILDGNMGEADGFIFKTNQTHVQHSTCVGGSLNDDIRSMVVGSQNDTFVCGITRSGDFPFAEPPTGSTGFDAFVYAIRTFDPGNGGGGVGNGDWLIYLIPATAIGTMAIVLIFRRTLLVNIRSMRRREYEVAMSTTARPVDDLLLGRPSVSPDDVLYPDMPVPQWNHPTDHPDGGLDPERPVPQWNHPTDHPDGGLDPERPVPQWNHPTDHPDGGLHPQDPEQLVPQWNHPTDHPDGTPKLQSIDAPSTHLAEHPDGCLCPLCSPREFIEPTPKDIVEKKLKRSKKPSSDVELD